MASFESSNSPKQKLRKRPILKLSSSSESECADFKNIDKLSKADAGLFATEDKKYNYDRNNYQSKNDDACSSTNQLFESDHFSESDGSQAFEDNGNKSMNGSGDDGDFDNNLNENINVHSYEIENISEDDVNLSSDDIDKSRHTENGSNFLPNMRNNLESTSELRSPGSTYDFSDDRCLLRIEKLIIHVCQEVESMKTDIKGLKEKSNETKSVVQKLVIVCKDLAVEVFACTEEIKKRNGMFTDLLVPDIKLPIKKRKQYINNELALGKHKIVDNMVSTSFEKSFFGKVCQHCSNLKDNAT